MENMINFNGNSEIMAAFNQLVNKALEPSGLDIILTEAHKKIIFDVLENTDDKDAALDFVCGYKKNG